MFIIGSNTSPKLVKRVRPAVIVAGGLLMAAVGLGMLSQINTTSLALVVIGNALMSLGFSFTFTLTVDLVISAAPPDRAGAASALSETGAELGGALGLALLGSLGVAIYRSQIAAAMPSGLAADMIEAVKDTLGGAVMVAGRLPEQIGGPLLLDAREAFILGMRLTSLIGTVFIVGLAVLTAVMLRHIEIHGDGQEDEIERLAVAAEQLVAGSD
jgi:DHA2 family multidrug resistance protein-like MFS transporter